jgi:CBS domain-containing protein
MKKLSDILQAKGTNVFTIGPRATLADVVSAMVEHNCGSLVVCELDKVVGIISERDILRACATRDRPLSDVRVEERMTRNVITGSANDKISDVMGWMTEMRIRHLPVLEKGKLAGMVSIGDIVKAEHSLLSVENQYLKHYIQS